MAISKTEKAMLRSEFEKVWGSDSKMTDYCTNKVASYATLEDGKIIPVDKQGIEKRFCFGESGYDYDDAQGMAAYARTSEDYFRKENMKNFNSWINDLEELANNNSKQGNYILVIHDRHYTGQSEDCKLSSIEFVKLWEVIDACGGSVSLEELPGKSVTIWGSPRTVATKEDIERILEAYKTAAADHEKKVNSYLKRYGTSKVHTWTYWRDA